jgi:hypothetical protein
VSGWFLGLKTHLDKERAIDRAHCAGELKALVKLDLSQIELPLPFISMTEQKFFEFHDQIPKIGPSGTMR